MNTTNTNFVNNPSIKNKIIFEHPLNETIRLCLILEQLFQKAHNDLSNTQCYEYGRNVIDSIILLLKVTDRPDLKGKLSKALVNHANSLALLENNPKVNKEKLQQLLLEIDTLIDKLHENKNKMLSDLREDKMIKTIHQYSNSPGGNANFNIPAYTLWLKENVTKKEIQLKYWLQQFSLIEQAVNILLNLVRNSQDMKMKNAENGFFQLGLETQPTTQLIRVSIETVKQVWPEISVGRHRLAIYFMATNSQKTLNKNLEFKLSCCY